MKRKECPDDAVSSNSYDIIIEHGKYERMKSRVNLQLAEKVNFFKRDPKCNFDGWISSACDALRDRLHF
jgi:hypothetical protein